MKKEIDKWKQFNYTQKRPEHTTLQRKSKIRENIQQKEA